VKAGQLLIEADLDAITAAGKPTATMVIVTNTDDYASVTPELGAVKAGDKLVTVAK
jgi:PTS system beta-glucosides-specific IIC component